MSSISYLTFDAVTRSYKILTGEQVMFEHQYNKQKSELDEKIKSTAGLIENNESRLKVAKKNLDESFTSVEQLAACITRERAKINEITLSLELSQTHAKSLQEELDRVERQWEYEQAHSLNNGRCW